MTKTETKILKELSQKSIKTYMHVYGQGPEGGWVNEGKRRHNAVKNLLSKGMVCQIGDICHSSQTKNGYTLYSNEISIQLV